MKTMMQIAAAMFLSLIVGFSAHGESIQGLDEVEVYALTNNIEYKSAVLETLKAYNNLESFIKLGESELSLSGSWTEDESADFEAGLLLPLFDQLSLTASADQDLESSIGVKLNPLYHSDSGKQAEIIYQAALAEAEETAEEVRLQAASDYLSWAAAVKESEIAVKTAEIKKIIYEDEKIRMENGEAVLDDVREAFIEWTSARTAGNKAVTSLQQAETDLYSTLNADSEIITVLLPELEDILIPIKRLRTEIKTDILTTAECWEIISAGLETESLEAELDSTWFFEPDLDIGGAVSFSPDLTPEFSATISVTAGLDDFKGSDIKEIQTALNLSREKEAQTAAQQNLLLRQSITAAETAWLNYNMAEAELEQAEELYLEAEFLFGLGEYSAAEVEESRLQLETSRNSLFTAAAAELAALRTLETYSR